MKDNAILISFLIAYSFSQACVSFFVYTQAESDGFKSVWRGITVFDLIAFFPALVVGSVLGIKLFESKQ